MIAKNNTKTKVGELGLPNFKIYHKATSNQHSMELNLRSKTKILETNGAKQKVQEQTHINVLNGFHQRGQSFSIGERQSFKQMVLAQPTINMREKITLESNITQYTKINSKWVIDLKSKLKLKIFRKKTQEKISGNLGQAEISYTTSTKHKKQNLIN